MSRLPRSLLSPLSLFVAGCLLAGAAAAQPADNSPSQYGDRQSGHFGDPGEGHFGNPASGDFDNAAVRPPPPGQKPLGKVVSGKNDAPPYVVLQRPVDAKPIVEKPLPGKAAEATARPHKSGKHHKKKAAR